MQNKYTAYRSASDTDGPSIIWSIHSNKKIFWYSAHRLLNNKNDVV